jgi:hypothetical protein
MRKAKKPSDLFQQVWVISLKRRPDRLQRFWAEIEGSNWPFRSPTVYHAVDGNKVGVPRFWQTGGGSYGCLRSHLNILERAILDEVESLLVLEDDAMFTKHFPRELAGFLANVPDDWQCLMLGGQHANSEPIPVAPGVVRAGGGGGIQRTHCYALRGAEAMKALYVTWADAAVHCDWVMGPCMAKFNTYAPDPFLVGQADGQSDISGAVNPAKFWRPPAGYEPVIVLRAPRHVMEALRNHGWHGGYCREPETGIDIGLRDIFANPLLSENDRQTRLKEWINVIQWEIASMKEPGICTIWHPLADARLIRSLVKGKVVEISADKPEEALHKLPADLRTTETPVIRVLLLRATRVVMERLRKQGWHTGHWRDEVTGQDNGIRNLFAARLNETARNLRLREIATILHEESLQIPGGVATLWHDEISPEMIRCPEFEVIEIKAASAAAALATLRRKNHPRSK